MTVTMKNTNRTKIAFNRKLHIAFCIHTGYNTVPLIQQKTGYPPRTIMDSIRSLDDMNITIAREGSKRLGNYVVSSWGQFDVKKIKRAIKDIELNVSDKGGNNDE